METGRSTTMIKIIRSFFPIHLIIGLLKYNLISLFYWSFLFLVVSDSFGSAFGIPLLFFSPEYLGDVSTVSFALLGFAVGGFTMAFNTYSYIKLGPRYPFLATLSRPFFKFCINNALLPTVFIIFYLIRMIDFQLSQEFASVKDVLLYAASFLSGFTAFITLSIFYFFPTTKEKGERPAHDETSSNPIQSVTQSKEKWYDYFRTEKERSYFYIGKRLKIHQSRSTRHLDKSIIEHIFAQNRINASIFEIITIIAFVVSGQFMNLPAFEFPAGMSIVLLLTIIHMLFSALMSWFHRWTYPIIFVSILLMNYLSMNTRFFAYTNYAYGIKYNEKYEKEYSIRSIEKCNQNEKAADISSNNIISILENWKKGTGESKPKLVLLTTSGGGSRSALWTLTVLQNCDEQLNDALSTHMNLITGASGGMVGAAYFREIMLRSKNGEIKNRFDQRFKNNLGKDLLNKLSFSASTKDLFYRYQTFDYQGEKYPIDRGYAFEEHLHENTDHLMEHTLGYYQNPEKKALIPMMIFSPTIVNDGRRLLISSQSLQFLTKNSDAPKQVSISYENIDFQTFFEGNSPQNMRFSSVMRASATFPFIMPMMTMPTSPGMQLMDAGIRDNYGSKITLDYMFTLRKWIEQNTSGVIIVEIRDTKRILNEEAYDHISLTDKLTLPFGNMYNNFPRTQDFDQEQIMKIATAGFKFPVDIVTFNLRENKSDRISLSWHLTQQEKNKIKNAFFSEANQNSLKRLEQLLISN